MRVNRKPASLVRVETMPHQLKNQNHSKCLIHKSWSSSFNTILASCLKSRLLTQYKKWSRRRCNKLFYSLGRNSRLWYSRRLMKGWSMPGHYNRILSSAKKVCFNQGQAWTRQLVKWSKTNVRTKRTLDPWWRQSRTLFTCSRFHSPLKTLKCKTTTVPVWLNNVSTISTR